MHKKLFDYFFEVRTLRRQNKKLAEDVAKKERDALSLKLENRSLLTENEALVRGNQELSKKYRKFVPVADFDFVETEPQDNEAYDDYVDRVSSFYNDILCNKIRDNLSRVRAQIADSKMVEGFQASRSEYDWYLRGMEAAFWSINEWGVRMGAQHQIKLQENK